VVAAQGPTSPKNRTPGDAESSGEAREARPDPARAGR